MVEKRGVRAALNLHPATPLALHFYVPDRPLEGFWQTRHELYPWIASQFNLVFAPNFSVYEDAPRMEHLINIKRSVIVYTEMLEAGIPAVPDIGWYELQDLARWVGGLNEVSPPLAALSFQGVGVHGGAAWRGYLAALRYLHERLRPDIGIVLVGLSAVGRLAVARASAPGRRLHVLNTDAFYRSRVGRGSGGPADGSAHRDELFIRNVAALDREYAALLGEGGGGVEGIRERGTPPLPQMRL